MARQAGVAGTQKKRRSSRSKETGTDRRKLVIHKLRTARMSRGLFYSAPFGSPVCPAIRRAPGGQWEGAAAGQRMPAPCVSASRKDTQCALHLIRLGISCLLQPCITHFFCPQAGWRNSRGNRHASPLPSAHGPVLPVGASRSLRPACQGCGRGERQGMGFLGLPLSTLIPLFLFYTGPLPLRHRLARGCVLEPNRPRVGPSPPAPAPNSRLQSRPVHDGSRPRLTVVTKIPVSGTCSWPSKTACHSGACCFLMLPALDPCSVSHGRSLRLWCGLEKVVEAFCRVLDDQISHALSIWSAPSLVPRNAPCSGRRTSGIMGCPSSPLT